MQDLARGLPVAFTLWVFAVGAVVGSFLNVVIARVPKGRSIVSPGSRCPRCGSPIAWYDNIPVLSWILLRARCRNCGLPISPRYPLVEVLTGVLAVAVFRRVGPSWTAVGYFAFAAALVALAYIDLDTWLLPHQITWPLLALGLASPLWNRQLTWIESVIGAAAGFALFAAIAIVVAAAMVPIAPLTIVLLLQIRDALYARGIADARARLADVVQRCSGGTCPDAAGVRKIDRPCTARSERVGELLVLCEDVPAGAVQLRQDLRPIREQLAALDRRILAVLVLFVGLLVTIAVWLLERGVGRRLERIDAALEAVGAEQQGPNLLPEGGDSVGRVGAAVNRLAQRLRDERGRTRSQIEALETANQKLREAREDLARSERLASVGRLAAGVAHEVGNPVSALIGYAALMRERIAQGKDVAGYTERIEREASRIDRIVRDLLELARPPAALQAVDLGRAVEVARGAVAPQHAKVAFETTLPPELPPVRGDEHYLSQVFVNLMTNAARAGASRVRVSAMVLDGGVRVEVEDDGKGIPAEVLPRLFEPFFTTAAPGEGSGLGLALCHATMERFGGSIAARNRGGVRGAVVELRFVSGSSRPGA